MTTGQVEGTARLSNNKWDPTKDADDPPRVWSTHGKFPGTAFTRSIGDTVAKDLGVIAVPEIQRHTLRAEDRVIVLSSDGVTDFMTPEECLSTALQYDDPLEACKLIVGRSYERWITSEDRTDDITIIVGLIQPPPNIKKHEVVPASSSLSPDLGSFGWDMVLWASSMGVLSGFLGGFNGIPGPPLILFFLHSPVKFNKLNQRANSVSIQLTSVTTRLIFYSIDSGTASKEDKSTTTTFQPGHWVLYLFVLVFSVLGVLVGARIFDALKDSQATIKTLLSFLLVLCGASLLMTALF